VRNLWGHDTLRTSAPSAGWREVAAQLQSRRTSVCYCTTPEEMWYVCTLRAHAKPATSACPAWPLRCPAPLVPHAYRPRDSPPGSCPDPAPSRHTGGRTGAAPSMKPTTKLYAWACHVVPISPTEVYTIARPVRGGQLNDNDPGASGAESTTMAGKVGTRRRHSPSERRR
jgi:hypothetical protein